MQLMNLLKQFKYKYCNKINKHFNKNSIMTEEDLFQKSNNC